MMRRIYQEMTSRWRGLGRRWKLVRGNDDGPYPVMRPRMTRTNRASIVAGNQGTMKLRRDARAQVREDRKLAQAFFGLVRRIR